MTRPAITYRPALPSDQAWLFALKIATMRDYVAAVYGWDEEVQRRMFAEKFDPARLRIIQVDGRDAGLLEVEEKEDHLFLARIEVLPALQNQGIGSSVIRSLLAEGGRKKKAVLLQVLRPNPARRLYDRLGFAVSTETTTHYQMRTDPVQTVSLRHT